MKVDVKPWDGAAWSARVVEEARRIQREVAEFIAARAELHCPVDTGKLRASIRVVVDEHGDFWVLVPPDYAASVEFGTTRGPDPFLRLALAEGRQKYGELVDAVKFGRG